MPCKTDNGDDFGRRTATWTTIRGTCYCSPSICHPSLLLTAIQCCASASPFTRWKRRSLFWGLFLTETHAHSKLASLSHSWSQSPKPFIVWGSFNGYTVFLLRSIISGSLAKCQIPCRIVHNWNHLIHCVIFILLETAFWGVNCNTAYLKENANPTKICSSYNIRTVLSTLPHSA